MVCEKNAIRGVWNVLPVLVIVVISAWMVCGSPLQTANRIYDEFKCRDPKTSREMLIGEVLYRRGQCIRAQCLVDLKVWEDRCQVPNLEGNCSEIPPANEFLDYPKCCPLYECKMSMNDNGRTQETRVYDHYGNRKSTYVTQVFTRRVDNVLAMGGDANGNGQQGPVVTQFKL